MLIRVAFFACADLPEDLTSRIASLPFGASESARLCAIRHPKAQRESLAALLALSSLCGGASWTITRDADGKPRFLEEGAPRFNLSHADGVAVAALSWDGEVGVDLEQARDAQKEAAVAARYFTPTEQATFAAEGDFSALWTRKEARAKCLGLPLSSVLSRDLSLPVRTFRTRNLTLSLAAEHDFEVECYNDLYLIQEVFE